MKRIAIITILIHIQLALIKLTTLSYMLLSLIQLVIISFRVGPINWTVRSIFSLVRV
jgi:hypothetical protein